MNSKIKKRAIFGLAVLVLAFGVFQVLDWLGNDPDLLPGDSKGLIATVEYLSNGSRIVVWNADGKRTDLSHVEGRRDRDPVWRPDGQRLYFVSDRDDNAFQIFRWRPGAGEVDKRSLGTGSKNTPHFGDTPDIALIISRGVIHEYSPKQGSTNQILPPSTLGAGEREGDSRGDIRFSGSFGEYGSAFLSARWAGSKRYIVATMRQEQGMILVLQDMQLVERNGKSSLPPLMPVAAAEHIDFDVNTAGDVIFTVRGFHWPLPEPEAGSRTDAVEAMVPEEFRKGGKLLNPYDHGVFSFNPSKATDGLKSLGTTTGPEVSFGMPCFSPDGTRVAFVTGSVDANFQFQPSALNVAGFPFTSEERPAMASQGEIRDPAFLADSKSIVFSKADGGIRGIFVVNPESGEKRISPEGADFGNPSASWQQ